MALLRFLKASKESECDGVMVLKDVTIKGGSLKEFREEGVRGIDYVSPHLEKIWVCNGCGHEFVE